MNEITVREETRTALSDADLIRVMTNSLYPGAKAESCALVLNYCRAAGLDPMQKPVHIVPMNVKVGPNKWEWRDVIMPGIDQYRIKASRSGEYAGLSKPEFGPTIQYTLGGRVVDVPEWCQITVKRIVHGLVAEFTALEFWIENYATGGKDTDVPNAMWQRRSRGQLAKCAEAQALRKAFPEFSSGPTAEEMEGQIIDLTAHEAPEFIERAPLALPDYSAANFTKNRDAWEALIRDGKKTGAEIIALVETKAKLGHAQKEIIMGFSAAISADVDEFIAEMEAAE